MRVQRLSFLTWVVGAACVAGSCSRHADLVDERDTGVDLGPMNPFDESALVDLQVPFSEPPFAVCSERPEGACTGNNDFPCEFNRWFTTSADDCQRRTGCRTNGWVVADMAENGCVERLEMSEPNEAFAACLTDLLGGFRCPCGAERRRRFLGIDNQPCFAGERACGPSEFPCNDGEVCEAGFCVPAGAGGASG
jgi:hypothetical protein